MTIDIWALVIIMGIPSAVTGLGVWYLQRKIDRAEKARAAREAAKTEHQIMMVDLSYASLALGEATAAALKNGKCNGEVTAALAYAVEIKHKHRDFLKAQGVKQL